MVLPTTLFLLVAVLLMLTGACMTLWRSTRDMMAAENGAMVAYSTFIITVQFALLAVFVVGCCALATQVFNELIDQFNNCEMYNLSAQMRGQSCK